jgi:hypothetical protein
MAVMYQEMQAAIDAQRKTARRVVMIGGIVTDCIDVGTHHALKEIGTCSIQMHAPLPAHVRIGATVEVQMGYPQLTGTVFRGKIPRTSESISISGATATVYAVSLGNRLNRKDYVDVSYAGPISLRKLFQSMCARRKVAQFYSDETTYRDLATGTDIKITYGNTRDANKQAVMVPRKTSSLSFLNDAANILGYYVFDTPSGVRQKRVSGMPAATAAIAVTEAWNALSAGHDVDITDMANYIETFGSRYTDADGATVPIRSIALALPNDPLLDEGWARDERSSELLDTIALADAARNVAEMDQGAPYETVTWETHGAPLLMPGDVVNVTSPTTHLAGLQWVMSVEHTFAKSGSFTTRCEGWRGAGVALAAGEDCVTIPVPGRWHIGNEYLSHYSIPSPGGLRIRIPFTVTQEYSSLTIRGLAHGCNSYLIDGVNTDAKVSRFEVRKQSASDDDSPSGSGNLPVLNEDLLLKRPYGQTSGGVLTYTYWSPFVIPIPNGLETDSYFLDILSGEDNVGSFDDLEVAQLSLTACGVGSPTIGGERPS